MKTKLIALSLLCTTLVMATPNDESRASRSLASIDTTKSLIMDNKYIRVGVSQDGTFGVGGNTTPGMLHDANGSANYDTNYDYLTPGSPFESWVVQYDDNSTSSSFIEIGSNNSGSNTNSSYIKDSNITALVYSADRNITSVLHQANIDDKILLKQVYTINTDTQFISVVSTITNTSSVELTGLKFARGLDPDPDVGEFGDYNTVNQRGFESVDESGKITTVPKEDIAFSVGATSGTPVGIYTFSDISHNAMINSDWSQDPDTILAGDVNNSTGDYVISLAFNVGKLAPGESVDLRYGYMFGTDMNTSVAKIVEDVEKDSDVSKALDNIDALSTGWHMVGIDAGITDMTVFNKANIDLLWSYSQSTGWSIYTNKYSLDENQSIIDSIAPNEGFWIKKLY